MPPAATPGTHEAPPPSRRKILIVRTSALGDVVTGYNPTLGQFTKSQIPNQVTAGELLEYTLVVTHKGPSLARNVRVVDNLPGSAHLETMEVPRQVCFLFGQEGPGLSAAAREVCDGTFSIAQFGSTRSINASAAAAIAMHAWVRAHADLSDEAAWRG